MTPPITLDTGVQPPAEFCDQKVAAIKCPSVTAYAPDYRQIPFRPYA
jgi:hypothetical protein